MYATTFQRQRKGYGGNHVGPGSGIHKSVDGGETWTKLTRGLPKVDMGRIGLTISPVDPKLVYADVEVGGAVYTAPAGADGDCPPTDRSGNAVRGQFDAGDGGIYRTTDGGETWEHVFDRSDQPVGSFVQIRADPKDKNRVYRLGVNFYVSDDMGKSFRALNTNLHSDYRSLWVDPDDNNHLIVGNDGGLGISWNRTATWMNYTNIPMGEYWELSVDTRDPYLVCGGLQDNGIWCIPSLVRNRKRALEPRRLLRRRRRRDVFPDRPARHQLRVHRSQQLVDGQQHSAAEPRQLAAPAGSPGSHASDDLPRAA
jgi:photosystem II stability/assembly factor-like uncharacterized protein